jgi:hypothetical protein
MKTIADLKIDDEVYLVDDSCVALANIAVSTVVELSSENIIISMNPRNVIKIKNRTDDSFVSSYSYMCYLTRKQAIGKVISNIQNKTKLRCDMIQESIAIIMSMHQSNMDCLTEL